MSGEEVRIVVVLDDKDVSNGAQRVEAAARRIKKVLDESIPGTPDKMIRAGDDAGAAFSNSFIKRLVLRDAIYGMLRGLSNVAADVASDIAAAFGAKLPKEGFMAGFEKWIADGVFRAAEVLSPSLRNADIATRGRNIEGINSSEEQRFRNELYKEDPRTFGRTSSQMNDEINRLNKRLAEARIANQRFHIAQAEFDATAAPAKDAFESEGDYYQRTKSFQQRTFSPGPGANVSDSLLAALEDQAKKNLKQADFELQIAKEKERLLKEENRKETAAETKAEHKRLADEKKAKAAEDKAIRHEAAVKKNREQHALAEERAEISLKGPHADLRETERVLDHQRATSAVMINGGLFGRNDSAAALVQHTAQQVSLLRSIDQEIKHIRKERSDLTLL